MLKASSLIMILATVALTGCGGVSIKRTDTMRSLPGAIKRIAVIPDKNSKFVSSGETSWGSTVERQDIKGMRLFFSRMNDYSKAHNLGVVWTESEASGDDATLLVKSFEYVEKTYGGSGVDGFHAETSGGSIVQTNGGTAYGMAANNKSAGADSKLRFACTGELKKTGSKEIVTPFAYEINFSTSTTAMDRFNHMFDSYPLNMGLEEQNRVRDVKVFEEKWDEIAKSVYSDLGF